MRNLLECVTASVVLVGACGCATPAADEAFYRAAAMGRGAATRPAEAPEALDLPADPTLADYLACAALNNRGLEAAFYRWQAARERVPQERALPDPQVSYKYYIKRPMMGDMEERQEVMVSQMVPWLEKLELRGRMAAQEAAVRRQEFQAERLKLAYRVKEAYYEYQYLARAIAITDENLRLLEQIEAVVRQRYRSGTGSNPDVIRAQVELGNLANDLESMRQMRPVAAAKLNAAMNRPVDAEVPWPQAARQEDMTLSDGQLLVWLAESSPELKAMDADITGMRQGIELARKDFLPDFMVGMEYMDMTARPGMPVDADDNWAVMIGLSVPIWWEKYAAGVREAQAKYHASRLARQEKANSLASELKMVFFRFRDARRKVSLYRDMLLPKARQSVGAAMTAFSAGTAGFTDLIDAQRVLLEFGLSHERALADQAQRLAELEMLVGRPLPLTAPTRAQTRPTTAPATGE